MWWSRPVLRRVSVSPYTLKMHFVSIIVSTDLQLVIICCHMFNSYYMVQHRRLPIAELYKQLNMQTDFKMLNVKTASNLYETFVKCVDSVFLWSLFQAWWRCSNDALICIIKPLANKWEINLLLSIRTWTSDLCNHCWALYLHSSTASLILYIMEHKYNTKVESIEKVCINLSKRYQINFFRCRKTTKRIIFRFLL
jgi:hypothetical protein